MRRFVLDFAVRIALLYSLLAAGWFFAVDRVLNTLSPDRSRLVWLDTYGAWIFVAITAILLYAERRQADRASRRLTAIVASSEDAIIGARPDGVITDWNQGAQSLFGHAAHEAGGRSLISLFPPEQLDEVKSALMAVGHGTAVHLDAMTARPRAAEKLWISVRLAPIRHRSGEVTGISATMRDITFRKQSEQALRRQAQIIDEIHDAVVVTDLDGIVTGWNHGATRLYGHTAEGAIGRHISFLYRKEDHDFLNTEVIGPLLRDGHHEIEVRMQKKSGEDFHAHLSLSLLRDEWGTPVRMIGYALDVTKRKEAERALRMAEVGTLASGLVHEVRNPLNAMRIQIAIIRDLLTERREDSIATASEQLRRLDHEVLRVEQLAKDFLDYGRPAPDRPETVELGEVVQNVVRLVKPEFDALGMDIEVAAGTSARVPVFMDRNKLHQVLLNLAENAKHAMSQGGCLRIVCERHGIREARIQVCDSGCGIPAEKLGRVFDAFYSTRDEGSGLGLAIVKQVVERAGGRVQVQSEMDRGTCFEIFLPLARTSDAVMNSAVGPG
jgi:two-component system sensor kinase FixL